MTKYRCNQCGAEDSDRTKDSPIALFCWKCRGGRGQTVQQQMDSREGMFVINDDGLFPWEM